MSDADDVVLRPGDPAFDDLFQEQPSAVDRPPLRVVPGDEWDEWTPSQDAAGSDYRPAQPSTQSGSGTGTAVIPADGPDSVLDALGQAYGVTMKRMADQARKGGLSKTLEDAEFYSAADRAAITEALAKAGIAPIESPRGLIELARGLLEVEESKKLQDQTVGLKLAQLRADQQSLEAVAPFLLEVKKKEIELSSLTAKQTIEQRTIAGQSAALVEQARLEEQRLTNALAQLNADLVKKKDDTRRAIAAIEDDYVKRQGEIDVELAKKKLEADKRLREYKQKVDQQLAEISAIRTDADLKRARRRAELYAKKEWIYAALLAILFVAGLVLLVAR